MTLYLQTSIARRNFKKMLGNANHLIITAMIGLDAISKKIITSVPENFPVSWNPRDCSNSANRSRILILEMALVRAVDSLDTYLLRANRKPFLIQSTNFKSEMDGAGRSVSKRLKVIEQHIPIGDQISSSLVATMIRWRNKAVHSEDKDELDNIHREILEKNANEISERFSGLNTNILIDGYSENRKPRLKEVASFISATHQYVQAVEANLLKHLDPEQYLKELIWLGVCESDCDDGFDNVKRKRLIHSKWGKNLDRKKNAVIGFLQHKGLSSNVPEIGKPYVAFENSILEKVIQMAPEEVYQWTKPSALETG